ncbi:hypothetical protein COJ77_05315 [Bacillus cereus]|nr:hypothetical protein COJ77_05315 [Bacillus cereus]
MKRHKAGVKKKFQITDGSFIVKIIPTVRVYQMKYTPNSVLIGIKLEKKNCWLKQVWWNK